MDRFIINYGEENYTDKALDVFSHAVKAAGDLGHTYVGSEHILLGILADTGSTAGLLLTRYGITYSDAAERIVSIVGKGTPCRMTSDMFTPAAKRIAAGAIKLAKDSGVEKAGTEHILLLILRQQNSCARSILTDLGCSLTKLYGSCAEALETAGGETKPVRLQRLEKYARELTKPDTAQSFDPVLERDREIERVIGILSRRTKNNPCLVGEAGVGKTAVVEGLAKRITDREVPDEIAEKRIFSLDLTSLLAGAKYRGDFEERLKSCVDEAAAAASSTQDLRRSSKSPLYLAPAKSDVRSREKILFSAISSGTSLSVILLARPSTTAVFPTPASPTRQGLFFVLLERIPITLSISLSLSKTGSKL